MFNNNHGSAVAIVMLFLAVISLLGVGLLVQSRLDLNVTSSIRSYEKMFGLGDGGATIAYDNIKKQDSLMTYDGSIKSQYIVQDKSEKDAGAFDSLIKLCGVDTDPQSIPGWEVGTYFNELWMAEGQGKRRQDLFGKDSGTPMSIVRIATSKLKRKD